MDKEFINAIKAMHHLQQLAYVVSSGVFYARLMRSFTLEHECLMTKRYTGRK